jgi:hypothetical protein
MGGGRRMAFELEEQDVRGTAARLTVIQSSLVVGTSHIAKYYFSSVKVKYGVQG